MRHVQYSIKKWLSIYLLHGPEKVANRKRSKVDFRYLEEKKMLAKASLPSWRFLLVGSRESRAKTGGEAAGEMRQEP